MLASADLTRLLDAAVKTLGRSVLPALEGREAAAWCEAVAHALMRHEIASALQGAQEAQTRDAPQDRAVPLDLGMPQDCVTPLDHGRLCERLILERDLLEQVERTVSRRSSELAAARATAWEVPTAAALTRDLERRFPDSPGIAVRNVHAISGGNSKQTVMFERVDGDGRVTSLVMRRDRPTSFVGTSVTDEFPVVRAVHAAGFPVPEPLWLEDRSPFIPGTFMVSRRGLGTAAGGPDGAAAGLAGNPLMMLAGVLARLHGLALGDLAAHSGGGIDPAPLTRESVIRGAAFWFDRYRAEVAAPSVTLECAHRWLCEHADLGVQPAVMVHGDAGFHNILVSDGAVTALLDWELAHPGAAAEDLCRCREFIERLGPFEEFLRCYRQCGGILPPAPVLRYYDMFIMARNAQICTLAVSWFNRGMSENLAELNVFQRLAHFYILRTSALLGQVRAIDGFDAPDVAGA